MTNHLATCKPCGEPAHHWICDNSCPIFRMERLQMNHDAAASLAEYRMRRIFELEDEIAKLSERVEYLNAYCGDLDDSDFNQ